MAHFNIGVAMARSGESDRAILAFETVLRFHPNMVNAHRYLATLHRDNKGDSEKAAFHQQEAAKIIRSRPRARTAKADRADKLFDLPEIPNREERLKILFRERPDPKPDAKRSGKTFVLVSGLPRFGASLMTEKMAAVIDASLYRQKSGVLSERHRPGDSGDEV
jgi:tetratricopeptide (TPR) repeat protein